MGYVKHIIHTGTNRNTAFTSSHLLKVEHVPSNFLDPGVLLVVGFTFMVITDDGDEVVLQFWTAPTKPFVNPSNGFTLSASFFEVKVKDLAPSMKKKRYDH